MPIFKISRAFLTAIALQAFLFAPAAPSPSPSPSLNNFNIQFNVNNYYRGRNRIDQPTEASDREPEDDEDVEENTPPPVPAPDITSDEGVDKVDNITVNEDLDEPRDGESAGVDEVENITANGDLDEPRDGESAGVDEDDNEEEEDKPIISDGPTLYELVLNQDRLHPLKVDELVLADTYEDPSREPDIQELYAEIQRTYVIRRDQLCPVCLTVLERNNGVSAIRHEYPPSLNQRNIGFFRKLWKYAGSTMVSDTNQKIPEQQIQSACDWLVPSDIQRRVKRVIHSTRALINQQSRVKIDPTKAVRKMKAYQRFRETLEESLDDYNCQDDYSRDVADLKEIFESTYN